MAASPPSALSPQPGPSNWDVLTAQLSGIMSPQNIDLQDMSGLNVEISDADLYGILADNMDDIIDEWVNENPEAETGDYDEELPTQMQESTPEAPNTWYPGNPTSMIKIPFTGTPGLLPPHNMHAPHSWNITREMWLAAPYNDSLIEEHFLPLMLVIVQHTVSGECTNFAQCAAELRTMQGWFIANRNYNIPYNFMIGNEGRVYEARGWNKEGAHTFGYNRCSMGIGFIGDYREERPHHSQVTELQLNRTKMLLEDGVRRGFLRPDFRIIGAKDVQSTASPGSNLYNALRKMDNFDHEGRFKNLNCTQIQEKYGNVTLNKE